MKNFLKKNKFYIGIFIVIFFLILGRFYYSIITYNYTFSSGDATGYILRSLYFQQGFFENGLNTLKGSFSNELFATPFFVPYILALFSSFLGIDLYNISFIITSIITTVGIIFLYYFLYKKHGFLLTFLTTLLISVNSSISFYSTEPLKAPYIVSFFIISIYFLSKGGNKNLFFSLFFLGLTIFVHLTGIFFIIGYVLIYLIINIGLKQYFNPIFILGVIYILFLILTYKYLNNYFEFNINERLGLNKGFSFANGEIKAVIANIKTGGGHFGFSSFIIGIKKQIGEFIFYGSIIGVIISIFSKKFKQTIILIPFLIIFLGFSIKWVASSHGSRYPFYVNWLFIYYFIILIIFIYDKIKNKIYKNIFISLIIIISFLNTGFFNNYVAGYRHQYKANKQIGIYIGKNIKINNKNKILLMGWPSTTYGILKFTGVENKDNIIKYGWLTQKNLNLINKDFLNKNNINYFLYEKTGTDYLKSYNFLQEQLQNNIKEIYKIKDGKNRKVILYKIIKTNEDY